MGSLPRTLVRLLVLAVALVAVVDTGSVLLTQLQVPDQVRAAAQVAAASAADRPVDRQTAASALQAARTEAGKHDIKIRARRFRLEPDSRVTLTGRKVAPTLLAGRFEALRPLVRARETVTVGALPFR